MGWNGVGVKVNENGSYVGVRRYARIERVHELKDQGLRGDSALEKGLI